MEGEPLSAKDAVLLSRSPGLVVDGLSLLGSALGARRVVLALGPRVPAEPVRQAARRHPGRGAALHGRLRRRSGVRAGQPARRRPGVPSDPLVPVFRRGVDGRPTLVLNAETLAQLALLARYGAGWFRSLGTPSDPGTFLATISATGAATLTHPGVLEVPRGHAAALGAARPPGPTSTRVAGGARRRLPRRLGAGRPPTCCSPSTTSRGTAPPRARAWSTSSTGTPARWRTPRPIARYLAGQSARQCGPCVNGLPRLAADPAAAGRPRARPRPRHRGRAAAPAGRRTRRLRPPRRDRPVRRQHDAGLRRPRRAAPGRRLRCACTLTGRGATATARAPSCCRSC